MGGEGAWAGADGARGASARRGGSGGLWGGVAGHPGPAPRGSTRRSSAWRRASTAAGTWPPVPPAVPAQPQQAGLDLEAGVHGLAQGQLGGTGLLEGTEPETAGLLGRQLPAEGLLVGVEPGPFGESDRVQLGGPRQAGAFAKAAGAGPPRRRRHWPRRAAPAPRRGPPRPRSRSRKSASAWARPRARRQVSTVTGRSPVAKHWSRRERASRTLPWAGPRAISSAALPSTSTPSPAATRSRCAAMAAAPTRRKSKRWTRERTVSGTLCGSVVQRMKSTWPAVPRAS